MGFFSKLRDKTRPQSDAPQVEPISDEDFEQRVLKSARPVLVFLWSSTCPYCAKMAPNVKNVYSRTRHLLDAFHANVADAPHIAAWAQVRSVPTTVLAINGKIIEIVGGFKPEQYLEELIQTRLALPQYNANHPG
ncbi:MAG: thioredoxin family protein [Candidatus Alcyoniella australis]|nr:thioredoxin family protein [Candidatus Alcyoniella australis]